VIRTVCVFCGSSAGREPAFAEAAREAGREIARRGLQLVYGGASVGLMGILADSALAGGAEVIGVLPRALFKREVAHAGLTHLRSVEGMHERKALMAQLSDAFLALPGGYGTLDELFEMTTWAQLGIHRKPVAVLDVAGYFAPLRAFVARAIADGFIAEGFGGLIAYAATAADALDKLSAYVPAREPHHEASELSP
jgi:uncharacterized protein (TIGR00730 family)